VAVPEYKYETVTEVVVGPVREIRKVPESGPLSEAFASNAATLSNSVNIVLGSSASRRTYSGRLDFPPCDRRDFVAGRHFRTHRCRFLSRATEGFIEPIPEFLI